MLGRVWYQDCLCLYIDCVHPITTQKAIENGEKSIIEKWLQSEGTKANECRGGRAFPRHYAVANGTALHWAVYYGQLGIAQLLLDNGAGKICNLVPLHGISAISIGTNHDIYIIFGRCRFIITVQSIIW